MSVLLIFKNKKGAEAWILRKKEKNGSEGHGTHSPGNAWAITVTQLHLFSVCLGLWFHLPTPAWLNTT